MKRWLNIAIACVAVAAAAGATLSTIATGAFAQGATPPRDTTLTGYRYIYLIRHAMYDYLDPRDERIGKGLDSLGRVQSSLTAERLGALPIKVDQLVSSTFTRAAQTADVIGAALRMKAVRDSDISECTPPTTRADIMRDLAPGEADACVATLERAWARYFRPAGSRADQHDVLVAHGNVIRWLLTRVLRMENVRWTDFDLGNGSITAIVVRPDGVMRLAAFSDTGHLPAAAQTWTGRGAGWSPPMVRRTAPAAGTSPRPGMGVVAPAPAAAYDTLKHTRPTNR